MPRRPNNMLRPIRITPHYLSHPHGSSLVEYGDTKVICTAMIEERMPPWLLGKGKGWVTAEYDMLPGATPTRNQRDSQRGKVNGRTQEISRLIGRSLRSVVDLTLLGERTLTIDCDVIQADGGTRTAAITGGYVALALAVQGLLQRGQLKVSPLRSHVVAVSAGIVDNQAVLDLDYSLDSQAHVDMNVVMDAEGRFIEIQGSGEGGPFERAQFDSMIDLALQALPILVDVQKRAIAVPFGGTPLTLSTAL